MYSPKDNDHVKLDNLRLSIARELVARFSMHEIRKASLENLARWKRVGTWGAAYEEWQRILEISDDDSLMQTMLAEDDTSARLRQSMPYVGLLPKDVFRQLCTSILGHQMSSLPLIDAQNARARRGALGLSQRRLAAFAGVTLSAIRSIESGLVPKISSDKVVELKAILGIERRIRKEQGESAGLRSAAKTCGVSYRKLISTDSLRAILKSGEIPREYVPHIATLLDEAPIAIIVRAVEDTYGAQTPPSIWRRLCRWAKVFECDRSIWR
jgi:transcriptional regulator with XRE-family HTH domain